MEKTIDFTARGLLAMILLLGFSFCSTASQSINVDVSDEKPSINKTIKIGEFREIEASQGIEIIYTVGSNSGKAVISTTPSAEKYLKVEVVNDKLRAYYFVDNQSNKEIRIKGPSIIRVSGNRLNEVYLNSGSSVEIVGNLSMSGEFELNMTSGANFKCGSLRCSGLDADLTSGAAASISTLNGKADLSVSSAGSIRIDSVNGDLQAMAVSGGNIMLSKAISNKVSANASSGSNITIENLSGGSVTVLASSAGQISLSGSAGKYSHSSGTGAIIKDANLSVQNK